MISALFALQISIVTASSGRTPEEVEQTLTIPVEEAAAERVGDLRSVRSRSTETGSEVDLELRARDPLEAEQFEAAVHARLQRIVATLPEDVAPPVVTLQEDPAPPPAIRVVLSCPERALSDLAAIATRSVVPALERLPGVAEVRRIGAAPTVLTIALDPAQLAARQIGPDEVRAALALGGVSSPGGLLLPGAANRAPSPITADSLAAIVLHDGLTRIGDIATVARRAPIPDALVRWNDAPVVLLEIRAQAGASREAVAKAVEAQMSSMPVPHGVRLDFLDASAGAPVLGRAPADSRLERNAEIAQHLSASLGARGRGGRGVLTLARRDSVAVISGADRERIARALADAGLEPIPGPGASQFVVAGEDDAVNQRVAEEIATHARAIDGVVAVDVAPRVRARTTIAFDTARLEVAGFRGSDLAQSMELLFGDGIQVGASLGTDPDVFLRIGPPIAGQDPAAELARATVPTSTGALVPLSAVARLERDESPRALLRRNGRRVRIISVEVARAQRATAEPALRRAIEAITLPPRTSVERIDRVEDVPPAHHRGALLLGAVLLAAGTFAGLALIALLAVIARRQRVRPAA